MKKLLLLLVVLFAGATFAYADAAADAASVERIAKLHKMLEKTPGSTGTAEIDAYVAASAQAATTAVANSELITKITAGEVTAENIAALGLGVKAEQEALKNLPNLASEAAKAIKKINPMKVGKAKKALDFANDATSIVTEESVYQASVLASLLKK